MNTPSRKISFPLGQLACTPGAQRAFDEANQDMLLFLHRHASGDWGEIPDEDVLENEFSLAEGFRLFSRYTLKKGAIVWIITEGDRSVTTILLPTEY